MTHNAVGMILAAGFGTRLWPLTSLRPKPIMEVAGFPIIHGLIRMLESAGVKDIVLNLHHQAEHIRRFVEQKTFHARLHLIHEKEILGTAGGIANAIRHFGLHRRQMVIMHGDIVCDVDVRTLIEAREFCSLLCAKDHQVLGYVGSVGVDRQHNVVELGRFFHSHQEINERGFFTGIQVLSPEAVQLLSQTPENSLVADVYPQWLKQNRPIKGHVLDLYYDDLGTPERIFQANMDVLNGLRSPAGLFHNGAHARSPQILVADSAIVSPSAKLIEPIMIMPHAVVDADALVGPQVVIGTHAHVGARARIKRSVILARTSIEKDEVLNCMIGLRSVRVKVKGSER